MKILLVSSFLPFPLTSGGHIRLYNLIKSLSDKHDITLVCEKRDYQNEEDIEEVRKICKKVLTVDRKKQWSAANVLKTGFSTDPFLLVGHRSEEMKSLIRDELVRESYDLIHVETFYVLQNLPKTSLPVVLIEHNVEYLVYKKYADLTNPLVRPLLYIDVAKIKRKEEKAWRSVDKLVAVSEVEKKIMKRADSAIVPNGVDTKKFLFRSFEKIGEEKRVLFIGDFKWLQNRDALEFILKEIWPKVISELAQLNKNINLKLWIVGKNVPEHLKSYESENVIFEKNQKLETTEIFRKSYLLLAPLRAGGGTSYKILEAMASGVGIVTTKLGIEGLAAEKNVHVLAAEDSQNLANCVVNLLTDASLYRKLTHNSRKFVEENYDWEKIAAKLEKVYMSAL